MKREPKKQNLPVVRFLTELMPGEGGTIVATPVANERLAEIGLVKGEHVQLVKLAPFGDPVILQVLDAPIIVRRADLAGITVA
ncbi:FeoA family protein [Turneriella parva]|uniref:Ferrous iron transporter FeoA-like domain-containing protein n=1 Tax=Turneriella parva (strain ATCC BAA-1111 / DSM 21527 / NCTC 11395 / H) TaxID=869212 RepID=I4B253_TURPD|nr:FeoA domain-containing protein [Turneriella parva]AFM11360.1 hypothetical protein Turpa_0709 [Turneriella parva DSM 21527]